VVLVVAVVVVIITLSLLLIYKQELIARPLWFLPISPCLQGKVDSIPLLVLPVH
jgi:hypothetical protein